MIFHLMNLEDCLGRLFVYKLDISSYTLFLLFSEKWNCSRATILILNDVPWKMQAIQERCKRLVVGALKGFIHMVQREAA